MLTINHLKITTKKSVEIKKITIYKCSKIKLNITLTNVHFCLLITASRLEFLDRDGKNLIPTYYNALIFLQLKVCNCFWNVHKNPPSIKKKKKKMQDPSFQASKKFITRGNR